MLYARGENYDVASRVIFCALVGSAFAMPLKYDNHLLGLVKVPRHSHPWADDVMSDCVPNCLFAMITSCPSAANWFLDQALALGRTYRADARGQSHLELAHGYSHAAQFWGNRIQHSQDPPPTTIPATLTRHPVERSQRHHVIGSGAGLGRARRCAWSRHASRSTDVVPFAKLGDVIRHRAANAPRRQ